MKWLKRTLQRWLGIEAIASRLAELDVELHPLVAPHDEIFDEPVVKKGYDKS